MYTDITLRSTVINFLSSRDKITNILIKIIREFKGLQKHMINHLRQVYLVQQAQTD
jgi:hypothetical protein